ncbi:MAG: sugar phosphate isomerase/epimerase [Bacilli bacterium]|nr:sugar phosphate isomerase/epimerase [Bacilli bacterium]
MKLAAQLYTVRDYTKNEKDIYETIKKVKAIGYNAVQVSAFGEYRNTWLSKTLKDLDLEVCATHTSLDRIINDTEKVIEEHEELGCMNIGLGWYKTDSKESADKLLEMLHPALIRIKNKGLKFIYHNHSHEFKEIEKGYTVMDYLRDKTDPELFSFLPDFYWVSYAGVNPLDFIEAFKNRFDVVHFKDIKYDNGKAKMTEIFNGEIDYLAIYNKLVEQDVKWVAVEQDICEVDPFLSLEISYNNIKENKLF